MVFQCETNSIYLLQGSHEQNTDLPFLPAPVGLQFHTIPMDSNAHKVQFGQMNFALFHCKGRINFGLSEQQVQVGPGWPSSPPCLGLEQSQAEHLVQDGPALGSLAFNISGRESQQAL